MSSASFKVNGTITGFKAGEQRTTIMVKPQYDSDFINRDDRESQLNLELDSKIKIESLPVMKPVVVEGVFARTFHTWTPPQGRPKDIENFRFLVLKITPAPAVA